MVKMFSDSKANLKLIAIAFLYTVSLLSFAELSFAEENSLNTSKSPLPNPLSLQAALQLTDPSHPDILMVDAQLESAKANLMFVESQTGIKSYIDLVARQSKPTVSDEFIDDSYASLVINKTLYDFGQSRALEDSLSASVDSQEFRLIDARLQHQYEIMRRF